MFLFYRLLNITKQVFLTVGKLEKHGHFQFKNFFYDISRSTSVFISGNTVWLLTGRLQPADCKKHFHLFHSPEVHLIFLVWSSTSYLHHLFFVCLFTGEAAIQEIPQSPFQPHGGWTRLVSTRRPSRSTRGCLRCSWQRAGRWRPPRCVLPRSGRQPRHLHVCRHKAPYRGCAVLPSWWGEDFPPHRAGSKHRHQPLHFHPDKVRVGPGALGCSLRLHQQEGSPGNSQSCWALKGIFGTSTDLKVVSGKYMHQMHNVVLNNGKKLFIVDF